MKREMGQSQMSDLGKKKGGHLVLITFFSRLVRQPGAVIHVHLAQVGETTNSCGDGGIEGDVGEGAAENRKKRPLRQPSDRNMRRIKDHA